MTMMMLTIVEFKKKLKTPSPPTPQRPSTATAARRGAATPSRPPLTATHDERTASPLPSLPPAMLVRTAMQVVKDDIFEQQLEADGAGIFRRYLEELRASALAEGGEPGPGSGPGFGSGSGPGSGPGFGSGSGPGSGTGFGSGSGPAGRAGSREDPMRGPSFGASVLRPTSGRHREPAQPPLAAARHEPNFARRRARSAKKRRTVRVAPRDYVDDDDAPPVLFVGARSVEDFDAGGRDLRLERNRPDAAPQSRRRF
jgi:hypothetical protein